METITSNTDTAVSWNSRSATVQYAGTFDSATVKLQSREPGGTWVDIADSSKTAAASFNIDLAPGADLNCNTSGGGGSMSIELTVIPIDPA